MKLLKTASRRHSVTVSQRHSVTASQRRRFPVSQRRSIAMSQHHSNAASQRCSGAACSGVACSGGAILLPAGPLGQDWVCKLWGSKRTTLSKRNKTAADIGTWCMASCGGNFQRPRLRCTLCLCTMHQSYWLLPRGNGSGGCYVKTSPNDLFILSLIHI